MTKSPRTIRQNVTQVAEKISILKISSDERSHYYHYLKKIYNDRDEIKAAESAGIEKGKVMRIEEGKVIGEEIGATKSPKTHHL